MKCQKFVKPTEKQLEFLDWELGVFFHFGIRTFNEGHKDWDLLHMELDTFNPTNLNCEQWIRTISEGGAKYAILTTKHHDGFANWPSAYTEYGVKNTPWKNGKGDVVREYVDACRKYGVKVGLYYSPAEFGSDDKGLKDYDTYFINQISELLINYGKIDYLWFDGCGSEKHEYDRDRIVKVIRSLQPGIMIFSMWDPDTRWLGNEEGIVPLGCRNVVTDAKTSINEQESQWLSEPRFLPYECDCKIRINNWFYSDNDEKFLRSLDNLVGLYDYSIGSGGNLLLNIAPNREGVLPELDSKRFIDFGNAIKNRFSNSIPYTLEKQDDKFKLSFDKPYNIKTIVIKEDLSDGESISEFKIDYLYCHPFTVYNGLTVGHKRVCNIPNIFVDKSHNIIIDITQYDENYKISSIEVY